MMNQYINEIKYIPTNYSSNKGVIETPWSIDPGVIEISGYQPRLRKRNEDKVNENAKNIEKIAVIEKYTVASSNI